MSDAPQPSPPSGRRPLPVASAVAICPCSGRTWVLGTLTFSDSVLHAVVYASLPAAIFVGRSEPEATGPPSFNQR